MSQWYIRYRFGDERTETAFTDQHPFLFIKTLEAQSEGHGSYELISWQKLTFEDIAAAKQVGHLTEKAAR